ncbi:hypothetical protein [uncultured Cohaesibacter sp.]|uniref:hypothetical protein n=1 Tax=uncultured Cohaesibacter sp. TaxID=1002546 RepID=UPI002AAB6019|nr:hypothetical protein [uncultured Cohaesibacter sp.]
MARSIKIATTPSAELTPIGSAQERDYDSIVDYVAATLGDEVAALFAEPVGSMDGARIDWYVKAFGRIEALEALDEPEQANLLAELHEAEEKIGRLAHELQGASSPDDRALGKALANATSVPSRKHIYALNGHPVLVAWGYRLNDHKPMRGGISKVAPVAAMASPKAPPQIVEPHVAEPEDTLDDAAQTQQSPVRERKDHKRCWLIALLWALLALLIAAILYVLLKACSISAFFPWIDYCSGRYQTDLVSLQQEVRLLENALAFKNENCDVAGGPEEPIANEELDKRLLERNAGDGALQISLAWNGGTDLDLMVRCSNSLIWFKEKNRCGASLDTDSNGRSQITMTPVENIVWQTEDAIPTGDLPIFVTLFDYRGQPQQNIPYTVRVVRRQNGAITSNYTINGVASRSQVKRPIFIGLANKQ